MHFAARGVALRKHSILSMRHLPVTIGWAKRYGIGENSRALAQSNAGRRYPSPHDVTIRLLVGSSPLIVFCGRPAMGPDTQGVGMFSQLAVQGSLLPSIQRDIMALSRKHPSGIWRCFSRAIRSANCTCLALG